MLDIKSMTAQELKDYLTAQGYPAFRAAQIRDWLHHGASDFDEMNNLPAELRKKLKTSCYISVATIEKKQVSRYDRTVKYLFALSDGECVESVLMQYRHGYSVCISTQVGCKMGCTFCATGRSGFSRDLTASEMLAQIEAASRDQHIRISNVVLMGMGEPLDNFDNVLRFLELVGDEKGLGIGMRRITLSTCGIVPKIDALAQKKLQINLAVSLHAPNDAIRAQTMPVARVYPMDELLRACRDYFRSTGRRVTFEYALIDGVNDSDACARELGRRLRGMKSHVNLIPVNSVEGTGYQKSHLERQRSFADILSDYGVNSTVRRTLGSDIDASCGQLRRRHMEKSKNEGGQSLGSFQQK